MLGAMFVQLHFQGLTRTALLLSAAGAALLAMVGGVGPASV